MLKGSVREKWLGVKADIDLNSILNETNFASICEHE